MNRMVKWGFCQKENPTKNSSVTNSNKTLRIIINNKHLLVPPKAIGCVFIFKKN